MNRHILTAVLAGAFLVPTMGRTFANPQGGQVVAGAASINTVPGTVTVTQQTHAAVINWQSFSINSGEQTKFIQPSSSSAVLNRVLGGQTSFINGTLSANGQVYLINGNGIVVGPGGVINVASFIASTRDIANADFLNGNLHFTGSSTAGVQNLGTIQALGGDIYLFGRTVDNQGTIHAPGGTAGLVAGDDILITQSGAEPVTVSPVSSPSTTSGKLTGVHNSGTITAARAELAAANGNIYALAINNEGAVRATTLANRGGEIWLTADSGTVVNSGVLDASATAPGGHGGTVTLKTEGTVIDSGTILARGGQGGAGGNVDLSGKAGLSFTGTVDLTAPGGTTGSLLIDPSSLVVVTGGPGTIVSGTNDPTNTSIDPVTVENALATANVILDADNSITVNSPISWSNTSTLTLQTNVSNNFAILLNANITDPDGEVLFNTAGATNLVVFNEIDVTSFHVLSGMLISEEADGSAPSQATNAGTLLGTAALAGMNSTFSFRTVSNVLSEVADDESTVSSRTIMIPEQGAAPGVPPVPSTTDPQASISPAPAAPTTSVS